MISGAVILGLLAVLGLGAPASASPTQSDEACFPSDPVDYPPAGPNVQIEVQLHLLGGHFVPGASGEMRVGGATAGSPYCGILFSSPVTLERIVADAQGILTYSQAIPADFELQAMHHVDIYRQRVQVASFDFCVDRAGDIAPLSACDQARGVGGPLPRTGVDHLIDAMKAGALLIALGSALLYWRRRRVEGTAVR